MRETEVGKNVGKALSAIASLHSQVGKLLRDCDSLFPEFESVYGNEVTRDLSRSIDRGFWMAEGVYRFWRKDARSVVGLTIIFWSTEEPGKIEEPILVVGRVEYSEEPIDLDPWPLWHVQRKWDESGALGRVVELSRPEDGIAQLKSISIPLYDIERLEDLKSLFEKLGEHFDG